MPNVHIARMAIILACTGLAAASASTSVIAQPASPQPVRIEMAIVETTADVVARAGIEWVAFTKPKVASNSILSLVTPVTPAQRPDDSSNMLALGHTGNNGEPFSALLQRLRSQSDVQVLATPSIMVPDGEQGTIKVAKEVPFNAQMLGESRTANPFNGEAPGTGQRPSLLVNVRSTSSADGTVLLNVDAQFADSASADRQIRANLRMRDGTVAVLALPRVTEGDAALLLYVRPGVLRKNH